MFKPGANNFSGFQSSTVKKGSTLGAYSRPNGNPEFTQPRKSNTSYGYMRDTSNSRERKNLSSAYTSSQISNKNYPNNKESQMPLSNYRKDKSQLGKNQYGSSFSGRNYQRAPSGQFKKYLDDSENVFWQNSAIVKKIKFCRYIKYFLCVLFLTLALTYFMVGRIQAFPEGQCPINATCGVFINCNKGYILQNKRCIIDPALKSQAQSVCIVAIEQLKISYGDVDCNKNISSEYVPFKRIRQVFEEFDIVDPLLKEQIYTFFEDSKNQKKYKYNLYSNLLQPMEKEWTFTCKATLFMESSSFYWLLFMFTSVSLVGAYVLSWYNFKKKARKAYLYLRHKAEMNEAVLIEEHKPALIKMTKTWNQQLWQEIDRLRFEDRRIVFYYEHDQLYWKLYQEF